ncbi:hypothetical protein [Streptomyces sp. NPDC059819]|uniref:hypothetical protein n=1 Tax=Streptomyces sp. NPDC059819 TaxID=3346963 RepID=UPI0036537F09
MFVILGLIVLIAAIVIAVAGVFANAGGAHDIAGGFSVFGYHVTGSTGTLFLYGIIVGAAALLGLTLLLAGARRSARHGSAARHGMRQSRREQVVVDREREDLIDQRDTARAQADARGTGAPVPSGMPGPSRRHWFGHRTAHR